MIEQVIKRNKQIHRFDKTKLINRIASSCVTYNLDPNILVDKIINLSMDIISTKDLDKLLIQEAIRLTELDVNDFSKLNWRFVASNVLLYSIKKEVDSDYIDYLSFIKKMTTLQYNGVSLYSNILLENYTENELVNFGIQHMYLKHLLLQFDYSGMNLLAQRYLIKYEGKIVEDPLYFFMTLALIIAIPEKPENRLTFASKLLSALLNRKLSLATPILLNLRKPNGNLSSCFIGSMPDDLDGIYKTITNMAKISQNGGGTGVNVSSIRSTGSSIRGHKNAAKGPLPWIKLIDDTLNACDQTGSRSGAGTVALDIWHYDILAFLDCQKENGDLARKMYVIQPQICANDLFFEKVEQDLDWHLFDPYEIKQKYNIDLPKLYGEEFKTKYHFLENEVALNNIETFKTINAKELFKLILKTAIETGKPYVFFKDTVNKLNPNKHAGYIGNANLCVESFSNFSASEDFSNNLNAEIGLTTFNSGEYHTCDLISLVLANFNDNDIITMPGLAVRVEDNLIDLGKEPIIESKLHHDKYRILGVGYLGLHDYLVKNKKTYKSGQELISTLVEKIAFYGLKESVELSKERGSYKMFSGSDFSKGIIFGKDENWFKENKTALDTNIWLSLLEEMKISGIRNGSIFATAPNCQDPNNKIQTLYGNKSIYEIFNEQNIDISEIEKLGQSQWINLTKPIEVPTYDGNDICERIWYNSNNFETIDIEFEDGNIYSYTPNHKLLVNRNNNELWIRVDELKEGDDIVCV